MENNKQNKDVILEESTSLNGGGEPVDPRHETPLVGQLLDKVRNFVRKEALGCDTSSEQKILETAIVLWDEITEENNRMREEFLGAKKALEDDPRLAVLFNELMRGTPIRVALVRSDIFDFTPQSKDYDYEQYQQALAEHRRKRDEYLESRIVHQQNCEHTQQEVEKFYQSKEASDEQIVAFADFVEKIFDDFSDGRVGCDLLERLWLGFTFEHKIEEAKEMGRIEAMNARIENRHKTPETDGLPGEGKSDSSSNLPKEGYIERILKGAYR